MINDEKDIATPREKEQPGLLHFRQDVVIKGLPYVFEGDISSEPADFEWSVSVPNWEEQKPKAEEMMTKGEITADFDEWLEGHNLGNGRVGVLEIKKIVPLDETSSIGIQIIQTETEHLPREFGYNQSEGIGSFLLNNLCALADIREWRIYLEPVDRGGKLFQDKLYYWYRRKGFQDEYNFPKETWDNFGGMQRWPKEPDTAQVISTVLQSARS